MELIPSRKAAALQQLMHWFNISLCRYNIMQTEYNTYMIAQRTKTENKSELQAKYQRLQRGWSEEEEQDQYTSIPKDFFYNLWKLKRSKNVCVLFYFTKTEKSSKLLAHVHEVFWC